MNPADGRRRRPGIGVVPVLLSFLVLGCGSGTGAPAAEDDRDGATDPGDEVVITVFAAASLTSAFRSLAEAYEERAGDSSILLNLAGSQTLAAQILEGAPADLFASANPSQMRRVVDAGLTESEPVTFVENALAIVVEGGNPRRISSLGDLARPDVTVVLGAPGVPVGDYAREALEVAGVELRPASLETDSKQVLAKVSLGEADAGIVYETDLRGGRHEVDGIAIPEGVNRIARYQIATLGTGPRPGTGEGFVDFLRSPPGRDILRRQGFRLPEEPGGRIGHGVGGNEGGGGTAGTEETGQ